jgi:hypothetical protein
MYSKFGEMLMVCGILGLPEGVALRLASAPNPEPRTPNPEPRTLFPHPDIAARQDRCDN